VGSGLWRQRRRGNHQVTQNDLSNKLENTLGIGSVARASSDGNYVSAAFSVTDKGSYQINLTLTNAKVTAISVTPLGSDGTCSFVPDVQGGITTAPLGRNVVDVNATNLQQAWILEVPFEFVSATEMQTDRAKGQIVKGGTTCEIPVGVALKRQAGTS
jgi:hypothetical protein